MKEHLKEDGEKLKDKAHEAKGRMAEKMDETKHNIKKGAEKLKEKAAETKGRIADKKHTA